MLRIGFGEFKGRKLLVPAGLHVRPATSMVREYLASVLADDYPGARVLDLFSGSGALGLQALSLGAETVEFVEAGQVALQALLKNIDTLNVSDRVYVRRKDVFRLLKQPPSQPYDLIFIDPPYKMLDFQPLLTDIEHGHWLAASGVLFIEHPQQMTLKTDTLQLIKEKKFGNSIVKLYGHASPPQ